MCSLPAKEGKNPGRQPVCHQENCFPGHAGHRPADNQCLTAEVPASGKDIFLCNVDHHNTLSIVLCNVDHHNTLSIVLCNVDHHITLSISQSNTATNLD